MKIQPFYFVSLLTCFLAFDAISQNSVGIGTTNPNSNAVLELVSPGNNQGILVPRLTTVQRTASTFTSSLSNSENGLLVFDSDDGKFYYWQGGQWWPLRTGSDLVAGTGIDITGNTISATDGDPANEIQNLSSTLTGSTVNLAITNGTGTSFSVNDADADPANEIQDLQLVGSTLSITNNTSATPINLSAFTGSNTDDQVLSYNGATGQLTITGLSGGNNVTVTPAGSAGGSLSGSYPNPSIAASAVTSTEIADGTVSSADILDGTIATTDLANGAVTDAKISSGITASKITSGTNGQFLTTSGATTTWTTVASLPPSGSAGGDLSGTYPSPSIANTGTSGSNIITAINNGSATGAINTNRLNTGVVLDSEAPTGGDISGTFGSGLQINANAVTSAEIADATITSTDILNGTIATADIANLAITDAKIASGITESKVKPSATDGQVLTTSAGTTVWANVAGAPPTGAAGGDLTGTYPNPTINNTAGAGTDIMAAINVAASSGTINTSKLNSSVVLDTEVPAAGDVAGTFGAGLTLNNNAVTTAKIQNSAVTDAKIASGITASKITAGVGGQVLTTVGTTTQWANPTVGTVTSIATGTGLSGGPITSTGTISLANTAVAPGTYGSGTAVPRLTIDAQGRVTSATTQGFTETQDIGAVLSNGSDGKNSPMVNVSNITIGDTPVNTNFYVVGSQAVKVTQATSEPYQIIPTDYLIVVEASTQNVILPDALDNLGRIIIVRSHDSKGCTLGLKDAADKIDALDTVTLYDQAGAVNSITLVAAGKDQWLIISKSIKY